MVRSRRLSMGSEKPDIAVWRPIPGFPEYEVTENREVRRASTKAPILPYPYILREGEGEFVEFWVDGRKHVISLNTIMVAVWPIKKG
jgi:hypothetical protein